MKKNKSKSPVIGIFDVYNKKGEITKVKFTVNGIEVLLFDNCCLCCHPMDEILSVYSNNTNTVVAEFQQTFNAGYAENKYDFDFDTNFEF